MCFKNFIRSIFIELINQVKMDKLNRFNGWVSLVAFSCVVLGTIVDDIPKAARGGREDYLIACCSIALALGTVAIIGYLSIPRLIGGIFEAITGLVLLALWCAGIAVAQRPNNSLATVTFPGVKTELIRNPNLYFFSWGSFISSVFIMASLLQEWKIVDVQVVPKKLMKWYLLLTSSLVVLGSASNQRVNTCSSVCLDGTLNCFDTKLCKRTDFAVAVGVVGAGLSLIPILWSLFGDVMGLIETTIACFTLALYCVGVAFITSPTGPGGTIGNLYFFMWFGFGISAILAFQCFQTIIEPYHAERDEEEEHASSEEENNPKKKESGKDNISNVVENA